MPVTFLAISSFFQRQHLPSQERTDKCCRKVMLHMLFWFSYVFVFGLVNLNSAFARHCGNYSPFLKSIILKCLLHISTHPHMPYVTCSCLIFQALGSFFPSLYSFPVTPILSYSVLASNLSFFPLPAPNFFSYTHGEGRKWSCSISPR